MGQTCNGLLANEDHYYYEGFEPSPGTYLWFSIYVQGVDPSLFPLTTILPAYLDGVEYLFPVTIRITEIDSLNELIYYEVRSVAYCVGVSFDIDSFTVQQMLLNL